MEPFFHRHKNVLALGAVLFAQFLLLAAQIKKPAETGTPLLRIWALGVVLPVERGIVHSQEWVHDTWNNYFYLRNVRRENESLRQQLEQTRLQQVRLQEDANQARRIQVLLGFKEQFVHKTIAAQVIGTSGSERSQIVYIDKGSNDGIKPDMAVITPEGIVGKVLNVLPTSAQVLEITDPTSGVGAVLTTSRLHGILKGTVGGTESTLNNVMSDEKVNVGDDLVTSGGDRIFPKGLPIGKVARVAPGKDLFLDIRVHPAAPLDRLEEVLVISETNMQAPDPKELGPIRAVDILAERLPGLPAKPPEGAPNAQGTGAQGSAATPGAVTTPGTAATPAAGTTVVKPNATTPAGASGAAVKPNTTASSAGVGAGAAKPTTLPARPSGTTTTNKPAGTATTTGTTQNSTGVPAAPRKITPTTTGAQGAQASGTQPKPQVKQPTVPAQTAPAAKPQSAPKPATTEAVPPQGQ
jgi:rod shape-determining protein MreC